ncbi:hypothetical protein MPER_06615 [Moniliophthora perniciosa FA553]|nr:hypothetical protein MPER_06615 [Moniliophthora perniciosa FA553]
MVTIFIPHDTLLGPETMVNNPSFEALIQHHPFMRHPLNLTIDKAHTVEEWGSTFRDAYARIGVEIIQALRHHLNIQPDGKNIKYNLRPSKYISPESREWNIQPN